MGGCVCNFQCLSSGSGSLNISGEIASKMKSAKLFQVFVSLVVAYLCMFPNLASSCLIQFEELSK